MVQRALRPGVYVPLPTFFDENQEIDYFSYKEHLLNLATKGMVPVCAGSLGEAVHLSFDERIALIQFIRVTLDEADLTSTPIVVGVGGLSTRETIELARAAAKSGADAGMVIPPAYYAASLSADAQQVIQYYIDICEGSPIPLLLYNFPTNAGGQDMPSAVISEIIKKAPNLCGVKLTCGDSIGKLVRLNAEIQGDPNINGARPFPFLLLDGLIADLAPWVQCGGHGTVSGIPNFAPTASTRLWELLNTHPLTPEEATECARLQAILSNADVVAVPGGIRAMKYALHKMHGYGMAPRKPLLPLKESEGQDFMNALRELIDLEAEYIRK
ncbi:dihydrodipicolinate synthase, putative [Talaromyces stipitatus ATCC 10500]|uniref:Dihydrodipicolinate synthase, putative n=1 Tax=Talaromyces stipitatus (strain ATCC 10500 / CBS 375.48 / QM 6759 / NRRL 1006) TaxID=441959 RepID=B8LWZ4_TALSN|nr:dihydrodipicolinate synthase, putative [Talaromyces stipitatus ATCC 10500]EED24627.1 dihydrodipicolinate synthase, putative [Talaromyces stipitatus ATCC 10500]